MPKKVRKAKGRRVHDGAGLTHEAALGFQMRVTWEIMRGALQESLAKEGVRFAHWSYLRVLWSADGLTQNELSERIRRVGGNTVSALNALQRAGWVKRVRSREDRRTVHVHLTPAGRALEKRLVPLAAAIQRRATADIPARDIAVLRRVLARMRVNLGAA
jgi:DNA-binding MarR family transcriptional regulator